MVTIVTIAIYKMESNLWTILFPIVAFRKNTSYVRKEKLLNNPFRNSYDALWVLYENILELIVN